MPLPPTFLPVPLTSTTQQSSSTTPDPPSPPPATAQENHQDPDTLFTNDLDDLFKAVEGLDDL
jgi:hypothetical protein